MSNTKHTPGPWVISPASTNTATWDEIYSADMKVQICSMEMLKQRMMYIEETIEQLEDTDEIDEAIANAKLIAAAPSMKNRIIEAIHSLTIFVKTSKLDGVQWGQISNIINDLNTAIKKATE